MRILKRNLAFVLALVMALSLTVSAANVTDYTDADEITFVEAVDVMTAIGVLEGTDGEFNPAEILTREQAAKIIAYLMLGKTAADNLNVAEAPFADVPANRWSAGYIAYCASQGIVGGYGDGNFGPKDQLTGTQFAKMLLCAVGYGVNGEFTGFGWESEVNALALKLGVFKGNLGVNFSGACKREEAALYAFNTLRNVATVEYSELFGTYYSGATVLDTENYTTLNEECKYYVYSQSNVDEAKDAFGRNGYVWVDTQGTKKTTDDVVLTGVYGNEADLTYVDGVKLSKIYDDLGLTAAVDATVLTNGVDNAETVEIADVDTEFAGKGVLVEVYVDEVLNAKEEYVDVYTIVVVNTYLAEVTEVDAEAEEDQTTITVVDGTDYTVDTVEFEEGDLVLVTIATEDEETTVQSIELVEPVTGVVTANATSYIKIDGEKISKSANKVSTFASNKDLDGKAIDYTSTYNLIVDNYGYAMAIDMVEEDKAVAEGYVIVTDKNIKAGSTWTDATAKVKVQYLADGTTAKLPLQTRYNKDDVWQIRMNGAWVTGNADIVDATGATVYGYTMTEDGEIVLQNLDRETEFALDVTKNDATVAFDGTRKVAMNLLDGKSGDVTLRLNTATVVTVVDDGDIDTYEGYADLKNVTISGIKAAVVIVDGSVVEEMIILGTGSVEQEDVIAYYGGAYETTGDGALLTVYVGKDVETYYVEGGDKLAKGLYFIEIDDTEATLEAITSETVTDDYAFVVAGTVYADATTKSIDLADGGLDPYFFAEDAVLYNVTDGIKTIGATAIDEGDTVTLVLDAADDAVLMVYVTAQAK